MTKVGQCKFNKATLCINEAGPAKVSSSPRKSKMLNVNLMNPFSRGLSAEIWLGGFQEKVTSAGQEIHLRKSYKIFII